MASVKERLAAYSADKTPANAASKAALQQLRETGNVTYRGTTYTMNKTTARGKSGSSHPVRRTLTEPASSYLTGGTTSKRLLSADERIKNRRAAEQAASSYAAVSGVTDPDTFQQVQQGVTNAAAARQEAKGAPAWEDMFAKDRNYVDLAKKGDWTGAAANFIGTGLQAAQSLYLNAINAGTDFATGKKPEFHYNMDYSDYEKEVAKKTGQEKTMSEKIGDKNKGAGALFSLAMETLTDPTEYISGGMFNDAAKALGTAKPGSTEYMKALQKGTFSQVPKANLTANTAETAQDARKGAPELDDLETITSEQGRAAGRQTDSAATQTAKAADPFEQEAKRIADARKTAEAELEDAKAGFRQYYAEYRSTTPETRRADLLSDAEAAKKKVDTAQAEVDRLAKAAGDLETARAARKTAESEAEAVKLAAAKEAEAARTRMQQTQQIAGNMDTATVHRADLDALNEIGVNDPIIAAMRRNYGKGEVEQAALYGLYKKLDETDSLEDALKIRGQITELEKKLDGTADLLTRSQQKFISGTKQPAALDSLDLTETPPVNAVREAGPSTLGKGNAADGFHPGARVWAGDRNNYGTIQERNASGTYDVLFHDTATGRNKTVEMPGDLLQEIDQNKPRPALDELPDFASSNTVNSAAKAPEDDAAKWRRVWSAEEGQSADAVNPSLRAADDAKKTQIAARNADEADPRELEAAKALVEEIDPDTAITSGFESLPEDTFWKLNNPKGAHNKDISRVLDSVAGKDTKVREVLRKYIERPIMEAKSRYAHRMQNKLDQYYEATKELGIKQGSRESAAVQWYGEGYRRIKTKGNIEEIPYTLADLQRDFPDTWQNIQQMDTINRRIYSDYIDQLNGVLGKIYPNVEENAKKSLTRLQAQRDGLQNKIRTLQEGLQAAPDSKQYAGELQSLMQQVQANDKEIITLQRAIESGEIFRNKRVFARKDYYHHWQEMDDGFSAIKNIFQTSADIDPRLVGVSDWTKPKTKWAGFMQARKGIDSAEDSVGGMVKYIQAAEYKINIDPEITRLRVTVRDLQNGTAETKNANGFIRWLTDYANDLAGKTNPLDRGIQETVIGRSAMKKLRWLNNRVKGNAVMGNLSSVVSQVYNLPNVVGYVKNPVDLAAGMADTARVSLGDKKMKNLLSQSGFLTERYLDHSVRQFDEGVLKAPEKLASWLMEIGDRKVAEMSWFSAYRQAERKGLQNAVEYADDLTRRAVAGRGIGEIPLIQKSEITKLIAPFQVEVNNAYQMLKEKMKQKDALSIIEVFGTTWLLNELRKNVIDGRETGFDPIHAVQEVHGDIKAEEAEGKTLNVGQKVAKYAGRLGGELLSNMPAGDQLARTALGLDETTAENLFGEGDPTRFGTGNIGLSAITTPLANLATGKQVDYLEPLTNIALPFGGAQVNRSRKAAEDLAFIPKLRANITDGFTAKEQPTAGAYTADNSRLKYLIDTGDPLNVAKAIGFGSTATKEGQAYLANGNKMLSEKDTQNFDALLEMGHEPSETLDVLNEIHTMQPSKDENGKTVESVSQKSRDYIMSLDLDQRQKQELDRFLIAGTERTEDGGQFVKRIPDYSSNSALQAFNHLPEAAYNEATEARKQAGIEYDVYLQAYNAMQEIERKNDNGELGNRSLGDAKRAALASMDIPDENKAVLNDLLVSNRKPTSYDDFSVKDLTEAAQNKWPKAKAAGFTEKEFGDVWRTIGKYTKTKDRLSAVVALGFPEPDAEFFVKLYTEKTAESSGDWKLPVTPGENVWISSNYGPREAPTSGASTFHPSVDIAANAGEPVFAAKGGIVTAINKRGNGGGYGTWVQIDHGDGYVTQYNHMQEGSADGLNLGDIVKAGQEVGLVGSTGTSTGPHLDFKMLYNGQTIDPLQELYGY